MSISQYNDIIKIMFHVRLQFNELKDKTEIQELFNKIEAAYKRYMNNYENYASIAYLNHLYENFTDLLKPFREYIKKG